jgi:ABC-type Fe3+ transport system substrate-binding protein
MSRFRGQLNRDRTVDVLLVCAIIVSASIIIVPYLLPRPPPEITLRVLTQYDPSITDEMENAFLTSPYAEDNNIVAIEWITHMNSMWNILIGSGSIDLIMGPWEIIDEFGKTGLLRPISENILSEVNESIGGVPMRGYSASQPIWCSYAISITIFELLTNETLLQEYELSIPETVEDLLSPGYYPDEFNSSLIGMDWPEFLSVGYEFRNFVIEALGWNNGIQNLTGLYGNSQLYHHDGEALEALLEGEIGITLTMFNGQPWEPLPSTISRTHLENMVAVNPDVVAVDNETQNASHSEAFIDYLLSSEGQSIWLVDDSSLLPVCREAYDVAEVDESIYAEFNWTIRSEGFGVSDSYSIEDNTLGVYMSSTALLTHSNLTKSWRNISRAYDNGSINEIQFNYFKEMLGKPLTIVDPISHVNESFTLEYARRIIFDLYNVDYADEVTYRWMTAANQRYELVLSELSALM